MDSPDKLKDDLLGRHIGYVHKNRHAPKLNFESFNADFLRTYISIAKRYTPIINENLHEFLIERYIEKRSTYLDNVKDKKEGNYVSPRTLLAIIRLA